MDVEKGLLFVEQKWYSPWGLFGGCVILVGLVALFIPDVYMIARVATLVTLITLLSAVWWLGRQPPRAKKGKAGIGICIDAGPSVESHKVRDHFVRTMRGLIKTGQMSDTLDVLEVQDHVASGITDRDKAKKLREKMQAAFLVYGTVSLGSHQGKPMHFLRMTGVVQRPPLSAADQTELSREFGELMPQKVNVPTADDLQGFEFISRWSELAAKYVLALTAAQSGQLGFAAGLFSDVIRETPKAEAFPAIAKIRERAPKRLARVNAVRAGVAHTSWVRTKDAEDLRLCGMFLELIPDDLAVEAGAGYAKAIWAFLGKHDVTAAMKWIERIDGENDPTWHFSRAFLQAYQGDLRKANQSYLRIAELGVSEPRLLTEVDEFLYWLLSEEPEKVEIYYCLGVIAWRIRGDYESARKEFGDFMRLCPPGRFVRDREIVERWLREIPATGQPS